MSLRFGEHLVHALITVLAFGLGLMLGPRMCSIEDEAGGEEGVTTPSSPPASSRRAEGAPRTDDRPDLGALSASREGCPETQIIYQCPPKPEPVQAVGTGKKKALPPPEPDLDPLARKRLLAWVRDRSDSLKPCRDASQEIYRLAVIMSLEGSSGATRGVKVNASRGEVPSALLTCVKKKIQSWQPPAELTQGRTQIVFGLTL